MEAHGDAGRPAELQAAELQAAELQRLLDAALAAEDFAASLRAELRTKAVAAEEARYAEELLRHNLRVAKVPKADPDPHPNPNPNLTLTPTPTWSLVIASAPGTTVRSGSCAHMRERFALSITCKHIC